MAKIEGVKVDVTFGHYETSEDGEHTFLSPDFRYEGEITIAIAPISKQILACKKEADLLLRQAFNRFIRDYNTTITTKEAKSKNGT